MWQYSKLPGVFGDGSFVSTFKVTNEEELEFAMKTAVAETGKLVFIEVCLPDRYCSSGLDRLGKAFHESQKKSS